MSRQKNTRCAEKRIDRLRQKKALAKKYISLLTVLCFMVCSVTGCTPLIEDTGISYIDATTDVSELSEDTINAICKNVVNSMTLNEKVGQMFVVDVLSLESSGKSIKQKKLTKAMKRQLALYPVGGVILYSRDIKTRKQTKRLIRNLQEESDAKLFICVDEEGGRVSRIASNAAMNTTAFDSMYTIGLTANSENAYEVGETLGKELKELGINVNFAPVADVLEESKEKADDQTNYGQQMSQEEERNEEIGDRSFGYDAEMVAEMVAKEVEGMHEQGVYATLKHFPGQGAATSDTHVSMASVEKSIEELRECDFLPFAKGIEAGAQFVMMSHESLGTVTGETLPASMSSLIIKDILRKELGFRGIVITDAMNMKSITSQYTAEEAAVACVKAGVDVILMPQDLEAAYNGIMEAVSNGEISEERIDKSVRRIIKCKIKQKILPLTSEVVVDASQASFEEYQNIGDLED